MLQPLRRAALLRRLTAQALRLSEPPLRQPQQPQIGQVGEGVGVAPAERLARQLQRRLLQRRRLLQPAERAQQRAEVGEADERVRMARAEEPPPGREALAVERLSLGSRGGCR